MSGVKLENTSDAGGGLNVGYIDAGDWDVYPAVTIPTTGSYTVEYQVASLNGGGNLSFEETGGTFHGSINIPSTGGWQNWMHHSPHCQPHCWEPQVWYKSQQRWLEFELVPITKVN